MASFGNVEIFGKQYSQYLEKPLKKSVRIANFVGLSFGLSKFLYFTSYALLYYVGAKFISSDEKESGEDVFVTTFAMIHGAFAASQAA